MIGQQRHWEFVEGTGPTRRNALLEGRPVGAENPGVVTILIFRAGESGGCIGGNSQRTRPGKGHGGAIIGEYDFVVVTLKHDVPLFKYDVGPFTKIPARNPNITTAFNDDVSPTSSNRKVGGKNIGVHRPVPWVHLDSISAGGHSAGDAKLDGGRTGRVGGISAAHHP